MTATARTLRGADVAACARIHAKAFPGFFLSELGERFLCQLYQGYVDAPDGVALVAVDDQETVLGAALGTIEPAGFYRRLLMRRWWAFALASLAFVLRRPRHLPRLVRAVTYRGDVPIDVGGALFSSLCVDPAAGRGVGRLLATAYLDRIVELGADNAYLTTDAVDNERTNRFHQQMGWRVAGEFSTPEGRLMHVYTWARADDPAHRKGTGS
jgi:GNAT superfamily N-acetyltransferase